MTPKIPSLLLAGVSALLFSGSVARAADPAPAEPAATEVDMASLLVALGKHAEGIQSFGEKGAQKSHVRYEELDSDGKPTTWTETDYERKKGATTVLKSTKDGKDNMSAALEEQAKWKVEAEKQKKSGDKKKMVLPFVPSEQPKYVFTLAAKDPTNASRVRIHFAPKDSPSEKTFVGEAWVDTARGVFLSMAGTFSKNPTFVDRASMRADFEATSPVGPMPSTIDFEGEGSFLWVFKKRIRVHVDVRDYTAE
ncbi:MAG: hypothetical protein U0169_22100 [Polyangiaceae bacterium]